MTPTERIYEKTFELVDGRIDEVATWLVSIGCSVTERNDNQVTLKGTTGVTSAIVRGMDPITSAAILGYLTAGGFWFKVYPDLLTLVNKTWKKRNKIKKEKTKKCLTN